MAKRITGISLYGIEWENYPSKKDKMKALFFYLESKRVLVRPSSMENPQYCVQSVLEIKQQLTSFPNESNFSDTEVQKIRSLIIACNKFLDETDKPNFPHSIGKANKTE